MFGSTVCKLASSGGHPFQAFGSENLLDRPAEGVTNRPRVLLASTYYGRLICSYSVSFFVCYAEPTLVLWGLVIRFEASLRFTISQVKKEGKLRPPSPYRVVSNNLIKDAGELGMPIAFLAFPGEVDFDAKLQTQKPNVRSVEIVRHRNDLCHGNTFGYFNRELGEDNVFFTPECLKELAETLISVSDTWVAELSIYRRSVIR